MLNPSGAASGWSETLLHGDHARRPHPPRSRTAYPQLLLLQGQAEAGVRRWPTTTQKGSSTPTSTAKEELVRSDDAHQFKGQFILHMELMTVAIKCPSLLLKRNLMVTIFHTSIPGAYRS
ncbi:uncharacterized protein [Lolium perenne]|uniref:uncharacterized protein n=1 Tax=Lolium perenne TaxID=4522 RepID=UPI003A991E6D